MAGQSSTASTTWLNILTAEQSIFIQPLGREGKIFHCVVARYNGAGGQTNDNIVLFDIAVDREKEIIRMTNTSGSLVMTVSGGLNRMNQRMNVFCCINNFCNQIGTIDETNIDDATEVRRQEQLSMHFCYASQYVTSVLRRKDLSTFNPTYSSSMKISYMHNLFFMLVEYSNVRLSTLKKALVLIAAVKLMYCRYGLDHRPMPSNLPLYLQPSPAPPASVIILTSIKEMKFKLSCRDFNGSYYIDILNGRTYTTLLVAQQSTYDQTSTVQFNDTFGVQQFRLEHDIASPVISVYDSNNCQIGEVDRNKNVYNVKNVACLERSAGYDSQRMDNDPLSQVVTIRLTTTGSSGCETVGCFHRTKQTNLLNLWVQQRLPVQLKALIICDAMVMNDRYYKLVMGHVVPTMEQYPYRKQA